jgi:hypothetical protein
MRGFEWYYLLFAVPVVALGFGVKYFVSKNSSGFGRQDFAALTKSLEIKPEQRKTAPAETHESEARPKIQAHQAKEHEEKGENFETALKKVMPAPVAHGEREASSGSAHESSPAGHQAEPKAKLEVAASSAAVPAATDSSCVAVEFLGEGPAVAVSAQDWDRVLGQYAEVKKNLLDWLQHNKKSFSDKAVAFMEKQILNLKLEKASSAREPDLAWRGIGVLEHENKDTVIRLGSGFAKLANQQPARAKFELARLLAQSIAPCEARRSGDSEVWGSLLKCLQVTEVRACSPGSYSEGGWAVSSTLAAIISPPGCVLPAFKSPEAAGCLKQFPAQAVAVAPGTSINGTEWKESRR